MRFSARLKISRFRAASALTVSLLLCPALLLGAALTCGADNGPDSPAQAAFTQHIRPLTEPFCGKCHGVKDGAAGIHLTDVADAVALQRDAAAWRKVLTQLRDRAMPPKNAPQPTEAQRQQMIDAITLTLNNTPEGLLPRNPGRAPIHRLNRAEYNNTVRDLFGVASRPADGFPADGGGGGGFDNNADTLFLPPLLMERYLQAAGQILKEARPERLFFVQPGKSLSRGAAAREILNYFALRAYRSPVAASDTARLTRLYAQATARGDSFQDSVRFALKAVLVSPRFLFRVEANRVADGQPYRVSDYELASRLSYFLWSSLPDEELFRLAAQGRLHQPEVLEQQARRMLRSPKSRALAENFAGQWLRVRDLLTVTKPDVGRFPDYTPALRDAMVAEPIAFFDSLIREDANLLRLLDSDYTYLNETLARHYEIPGVVGPEMRRVALADGRRGGILTMGGVLTLTSYTRRTSPVLRGKWILEDVFGTPPPPPPPDVPTLPDNDAPKEGLTLRQRLEKHRTKAECAGCHSRMDPLGFGLENYDAVGRWRDQIAGTAVDASGTLTNGVKFTGPIELKRQVLAQKDLFARNLTEKMLSYALGRGLESYDAPTVNRIAAALARADYRASTLPLEIIRSYPFQYRQNL